MLVKVTLPEGEGYRIDCDGCGLRDEHDQRPDGTILGAHNEIADAIESGACTECANSPQIIEVGEEHLCRTCRTNGKMSAVERAIYDDLVVALTAAGGDKGFLVTQVLTMKLADCTDEHDKVLLPTVNGADMDARYIIDIMFADRECNVGALLQKMARDIALRQPRA